MWSFLFQGVRSWKSAKGVALFATSALAVGLGSTTAIFTVVNNVLLRPLPYAGGDRFVALYGARVTEPNQRSSSTLHDLAEYERRTTSFDVFGSFRPGSFNLTSAGDAQHVNATEMTPSLAHGLGVNPILGRWFDDGTGAVLSNTLWKRLGADAAILGRAITLNGRTFTVTGVMPAGFQLPVGGPGTEGFQSDLWISLDPRGPGTDSAGMYFAYARRKAGVSLVQAQADVTRAAAEIAALDPPGHPSYTARLDDLHTAATGSIRPTLLLLFAATGLLLLITCANVATLLLARSVSRARETAIRVALGASQRRLALHYFVEGLVVSLAGAVCGLLLSVALVRLFVSMAADYIPRASEMTLDWKILLFGVGMAFLASALSSLAPLWQAMRTAPNEVLTTGVRVSAGARARRVSQLLVTSEIALAFTLLAISAVLIVHLRNVARVAPGFDHDNLLTFQVTLPDAIASSPAGAPYQRRLITALEAIPGVTGVGLANQLPLAGCCFGGTILPEEGPARSARVERTSFMIVSAGYFRTVRIPLRNGRVLTESDTREDPFSVVINQAAVSRYWPDRNPVGAFGRLNGPNGARFQIVGVVGDVRNDGLNQPSVPEVYLLSSIATVNPMHFVVRSPLPAAQLVPELRSAILRVDSTLPIHEPATMNAIIQQSLVLERVGSLMMTLFALAALLMATLGTYGVVSYAVRQRTVELGTRMALGSVRRDLLRLIVGGGLKMAAYGVAVGSVTVFAAAWLLVRFFGIRDLGFLPFASSTAIVASVALVASFVPAWRATFVSPLVAIRNETGSSWSSVGSSVRQAMKEWSQAISGRDDRAVAHDGTMLTEFVSAARRAESFPEALRMALATLCSTLDAESAALFERTSGPSYRCVAARPEAGSTDWSLPAEGFLVRQLKSYPYALPFTGEDLDALRRWAVDHARGYVAEIEMLRGSGCRIAVPLRTKDEILGLLLLGPRASGDRYSTADRQLLQNCAEQLALMVENARLTDRVVAQETLRRDLALASEVQRRLLPEHPPDIGIATFAAASLPARSVGGDYYDFIDVGDRRIGIALADVSGKGVAAALIMSAVQASLRIISSESDISLPELVEKMNRFLHGTTPANKYATFFYAQIDERTRQLRYVNAGHNPPYLLRAIGDTLPDPDGHSLSSIQELSAGGAVIGLFPHMSYVEATIDLQPGDVLVAFTDGVTEALNAREEEFGEQRLKDLLQRVVDLPAADISATISQELKNWIDDAAQYDDLTFIVMKVN